jgi:hypothetical protein
VTGITRNVKEATDEARVKTTRVKVTRAVVKEETGAVLKADRVRRSAGELPTH